MPKSKHDLEYWVKTLHDYEDNELEDCLIYLFAMRDNYPKLKKCFEEFIRKELK